MNNLPTVSVAMITYGHEAYIAQAIESVLAQRTNFKIELVIVNDCSPDDTDAVIHSVMSKFEDSNWIRYIKQPKNIGVIPNFTFSLKEAKGKYIALCEGDDYWTDPLKLQKQVDFMEANDDFSMCFTNRKILENGELKDEIENSRSVYSIEDVVGGFVPYTQTLLIRNNLSVIEQISKHLDCSSGDRLLTFFTSLMGDIKKLPDVTSVYRVHSGGVWSGLGNSFDSKLISLQRLIRFKKDIIEPEIGLEYDNKFLLNLANRNVRIFVKYGFVKFMKVYLTIIKEINVFKYTFSLVRFLMKRMLKKII